MGDQMKNTSVSGEGDVEEAVGSAGERIRRALESEDAGRVAGPGAKSGDRAKGRPDGQESKDEPPAADAVAP
ncbi:hypothetical protein GCM10018781_79990 [Kitasatospora indigofera]|uniref:Uncharacterized protein n=1 Tax=Kitasatospora indigofera TaxID=67307 RepID=A0A918YWX3_9ACTN|nr:hypothetical protein [Kitasatospora indigofera]GHE27398.1 hypothetical protein GCM10018781_79990 [Kitasatospora indigofera]